MQHGNKGPGPLARVIQVISRPISRPWKGGFRERLYIPPRLGDDIVDTMQIRYIIYPARD